MARVKSNKKAEIVDTLRQFFEDRDKSKTLAEDVKKQQPELIEVMREFDPDNDGIIYDPDDKKNGTAFVQQNDPSEVWNPEEIITWAKKNKSRWMSISSRVLDINKFEAEVANGNISAKVANKFKFKSEPPAPFIRRGKPTDESL